MKKNIAGVKKKKINWLPAVIVFIIIAALATAIFAIFSGPTFPTYDEEGWLFKLDTGEAFFVRDFHFSSYGSSEVYTESQVKNMSGLADIFPKTANTNLTAGQAKEIAVEENVIKENAQNFEPSNNEMHIYGEIFPVFNSERIPGKWFVPVYFGESPDANYCYGVFVGDNSKKVEGRFMGSCSLYNRDAAWAILKGYLEKNQIKGKAVSSYSMQYLAKRDKNECYGYIKNTCETLGK